MSNIPRNQKCPCGSGKKFKKCCLVKDAINQETYSTYRNLVKKIQKFIFGTKEFFDELDNAADIFFGNRNDLGKINPEDEQCQSFFNEWVCYDYVTTAGKTFIEIFLETNINKLDEAEIFIVQNLKGSFRTLLEIQDTKPSEGITVKDILNDETYFIHDLRASYQFVKWDINFGRIYMDNGQYHLSGITILIRRTLAEALELLMRETFEASKKEGIYKRNNMKKFLKEYGYLSIREVLEMESGEIKFPKLTTTTGESFVFCEIIYKVKNYEKVLKILKNNFEGTTESHAGTKTFLYLNEKNTILAGFNLTTDELVIDTKSKKRADKVKTLLEKQCGDNLEFLGFSQKSMEEMMEEAEILPEQEKEPGSDLKEDLDEETKKEVFKSLYGNWENKKIPLLNNMTPLEAMKTEKGKQLLAELFKIYENSEERQKKTGVGIIFNAAEKLKKKIGFKD